MKTMDPQEALLEAGRIAAKVRDTTIKEIKPGVKVVDICDIVQQRIKELGGKPGFPTNVDINHIAAHYCSPINDTTLIPENSLVKLDIGVHVDGYLADTAKTLCFDPTLRHLVDAAEAGLEAAINTVRAGVKASDIGSNIEDAIQSHGARPIRNLTGHKMTRYILHSGSSIPNINGMDSHILETGSVYAIEPFAVPINADGLVRDGPPSNIYRFLKKRSLRNRARQLLKYIQSEYRTLPFASRWVLRKYPGAEYLSAFNTLIQRKCITGYPQLIEKSKSKVAQAEHTVIVTDEGCEVTTA